MPPTSPNAPAAFHLLVKPTGAACNLDCAYCFYLDKALLYPDSKFRMSDELLELYIRQLMAAQQTNEITIAWQGGEPALMGLDFYRRAVALAEKYRRPGVTFHHTIQTNGTLLTDEWCEFFKTHDFLIGISIDGPRKLHDTYRRDKGAGPTFDQVMRGLRCLQKHGVAYNVLTAVNRVNADYPLEVYRFLRDEAKTPWMQFIPIVERINPDGRTLYQQGTTVSERSVLPEQLGRFLSVIFDEWVQNDVGRIFIQAFEAALANWLGAPSSGICIFDETCGLALVMEHNGDVYSCDHFVEPHYLLGNIQEKHMIELVASPRQIKFGQDKRNALPRYCWECDVRFACHGGCPKNRFTETPDGEPGLNYLCAGYKTAFHHIDFAMKIMMQLLRRHHPAPEVMAILEQSFASVGRNDPCP
ncbi:MAG: anaerobic sulfatase maturase, partial [Chloroflexi bacterium]|nr:anaerobic sulfatase maturase [Chloroflexota bacterium]